MKKKNSKTSPQTSGGTRQWSLPGCECAEWASSWSMVMDGWGNQRICLQEKNFLIEQNLDIGLK